MHLRTSRSKHVLKPFARKRPGTHWDYPFSRCRVERRRSCPPTVAEAPAAFSGPKLLPNEPSVKRTDHSSRNCRTCESGEVEGEGAADRDTAASKCSTGNCLSTGNRLSNFDKKMSSRNWNREIRDGKARAEKFVFDEGFQPYHPPRPKSASLAGPGAHPFVCERRT
jgi:hypothetical protein